MNFEFRQFRVYYEKLVSFISRRSGIFSKSGALAMASLLDALAHNQAVLAPAFAILQPEGFVFHLVDDSRWFTDPQACMGALLEYGEGVSDGSVWGSER